MHPYVSVFGRGDQGDGYVYRCPVAGCRYRFPSDVEDVAMPRHGSTHTRAEWAEVEEALAQRWAEVDQEHDRWTAGCAQDIERVRRWQGNATDAKDDQ